MARSVRLEVRLTPEVAAAVERARDLASASAWLERAVLEKLERDGVQVEASGPPLRRGAAEPEFLRRPAPRTTGGGKKR